MKNNSKLTKLGLLLPKIVTYYYPNRIEFKNLSKQFMVHFSKQVASRGFEDTIKRFKLYRLCVTRYLSGEPLVSMEGVKLEDG
jgi:hypothetical protein